MKKMATKTNDPRWRWPRWNSGSTNIKALFLVLFLGTKKVVKKSRFPMKNWRYEKNGDKDERSEAKMARCNKYNFKSLSILELDLLQMERGRELRPSISTPVSRMHPGATLVAALMQLPLVQCQSTTNLDLGDLIQELLKLLVGPDTNL